MKIRSGLVSNSSSSSFVIVVKKEAYEETLEKVHPYIKACAQEVFQEATCFGIPVVQAMELNTHGYSTWEELEPESYKGQIPVGQYGNQISFTEAIEEEFVKDLNNGIDYECFVNYMG